MEKKLTLQKLKRFAASRGGDCQGAEPLSWKQKVLWKCAEGHSWHAYPDSVLRLGSWCPECSTGLGERLCRQLFEHTFQVEFKRVRPDWLLSPRGTRLELDGYNESLKLAFEHQGRQRYTKTYFSRTASQRRALLLNDIRKRRICSKRGIALIEIPEVPTLTKVHDLPKFVGMALRAAGRTVPRRLWTFTPDLITSGASHVYRTLLNIAKAHGGRLLSKTFLGLTTKLPFECKEGHRWQTTPSNVIFRNTWCPKCAGNAKDSIEEYVLIAKKKGGFCLSAKYVNQVTKLKFKCSKGHIWKALPLNVKRGAWCAECYGNTSYTIKDMKALAKSRHGKCLSKDYRSNLDHLMWECKKGHVWSARAAHIIRGAWCRKCYFLERAGSSQKLNIDDLRALAEKRGGALLSKKYVNCKTHMKWQCKRGHVWSATADGVKAGTWCPVCRGR